MTARNTLFSLPMTVVQPHPDPGRRRASGQRRSCQVRSTQMGEGLTVRPTGSCRRMTTSSRMDPKMAQIDRQPHPGRITVTEVTPSTPFSSGPTRNATTARVHSPTVMAWQLELLLLSLAFAQENTYSFSIKYVHLDVAHKGQAIWFCFNFK